jgi:AAA15 family ATPase/GTPase
MYDVFISHKSDCKPWVRVLAQNLKTQGYNVFLDEWELVPGKNIVEGLYNSLQQSRNCVLVVTPEGIESGWVREEYSQMVIQKQEKAGFSIIPVVLGQEVPDFPFIKDILWVDFRNINRYRQSFYRLVCAIENKSPGPDVELEGEIIIPATLPNKSWKLAKDEISFVEEVFELFITRQAVLLPAQEDRWHGGMKTHLLEEAKKRYGKKNALHLVPPFGPRVDMENYFSLLGKQCGFSRVITNSIMLQAAFEERLAEADVLFLMVSGFENSLKEGQEELAGVLRNLNERFPRNFKILICGGEKLVDLFYSGSLSYLNHAEIKECPELTAADVIRMAKNTDAGQGHGIDLDKKNAERLLDISGGHPRILEQCFILYAGEPGFTGAELTEALLNTLFVWRLFIPFNRDVKQRQRLCRLLKELDVGPARTYLSDPLLKRLYWGNLLKRSSANYRLYWRCEVLRNVGLEILECKDEVQKSEEKQEDVFITTLEIHNVRHLKDIKIQLSAEKRKHLILTGKNGSGKTSVLDALKDHLLAAKSEAMTVTYNSFIKLEEYYYSGNFILAFYGSRRRADMNVPKGLKQFVLKEKYGIDEEPGKDFIQYIVNLKAERSFARDEKDSKTVKEIEKWFKTFEESLKEIFEDRSLRLEFDRKNFNFKIIQEGKEFFDFNTMADGYSALLSIVTDLILRMEKHKTKTYDVQGVVLIDELEAHLHIDLQKKVFPILTALFPGIQFIVSSHTPFILNSIKNVVIYDLERNLLVGDLSGYSYDGIVEGYFRNDKYSELAKRSLQTYERLLNLETRTEDEEEKMMDLRIELESIPDSLAPELKARFQRIELKRIK